VNQPVHGLSVQLFTLKTRIGKFQLLSLSAFSAVNRLSSLVTAATVCYQLQVTSPQAALTIVGLISRQDETEKRHIYTVSQ